MYDRHGQPLPVALVFDYINNHVDETRYNLSELFEHLSGREDVCVLPGNTGSYKGPVNAKSYKEAEFRIPYYNTEEGRTRSIQFVWMPEAEDYLRVFGKDNKGGWRHSQVLESDILGMKAFKTGVDD